MPFNKILLVPKVGGNGVALAHDFARQIQDDNRFAHLGIEVITNQNLADQDTVIVAIGGDGTVLHSAKLALKNEAALLGINLGNVGFLADLTRINAIEALLKINDADYWINEDRILLALQSSGKETDFIAFNEFAISDSLNGKMVTYDLFVNGRHAGEHRANGVLIATPTGATGYSLSAGGPILSPDVRALAITPVAPVKMTSRPIIVCSDSKITLKITHPRNFYNTHQMKDQINCPLVIKPDGRNLTDYEMKPFIKQFDERDAEFEINIARCKNTVKMLHPSSYNYFSVLKEKLGWNS